MIPPRSPFGLIQEDLWPSEWKILVACVLLNCTTRRAMEKVVPRLFSQYPDPAAMASANPDDIAAIIAPLGFKNTRSKRLVELSRAYLKSSWKHARELPGVGEYAAAAWEIFARGTMPPDPPKDHALVRYWHWRRRHGY